MLVHLFCYELNLWIWNLPNLRILLICMLNMWFSWYLLFLQFFGQQATKSKHFIMRTNGEFLWRWNEQFYGFSLWPYLRNLLRISQLLYQLPQWHFLPLNRGVLFMQFYNGRLPKLRWQHHLHFMLVHLFYYELNVWIWNLPNLRILFICMLNMWFSWFLLFLQFIGQQATKSKHFIMRTNGRLLWRWNQ